MEAAELRTIPCAFAKLVPDPEHARLIADAAHRCHLATTLAYELVNVHIRRCLDDDLPLPVFKDTWFKQCLMAVTRNGKGEQSANISDEVQQTHAMLPPYSPPCRTAIDNVLKHSANTMCASFLNNLRLHFWKRVARYVRHIHAPVVRDSSGEIVDDGLTRAQRKTRSLHLAQVATDVVSLEPLTIDGTPSTGRKARVGPRSPETYWEWISAARAAWGLDALAERTVTTDLDAAVAKYPRPFLVAGRAIARVFERDGLRQTCWACPLRRKYRTCFATFDTRTMQELLHAGTRKHEKMMAEISKVKKRHAALRVLARERSAARRLALGDRAPRALPRFSREETEEARRAWNPRHKNLRTAAVRLQITWREWLLRAHRITELEFDVPNMTRLRKLQMWVRWNGKLSRILERRIANSLYSKKECVAESVFDYSAIHPPKGMRPTATFMTDGTSARVYVSAAANGHGRKRKAASSRPDEAGEAAFAARGMFTVQEMVRSLQAVDAEKREQRLAQLQIVGLDPGKAELAVVHNIDHCSRAQWLERRVAALGPLPVTHLRKAKNRRHRLRRKQRRECDVATADVATAQPEPHSPARQPETLWSCRYTLAQRRVESKTVLHEKRLVAEKKEATGVGECEKQLSAHTTTAPDTEGFVEYLRARREVDSTLRSFYDSGVYSRRAWRSFLLRQRSTARFIERIKAMRREGKQLCVSYGGWVEIASLAGRVNRGHPPCIGKRLRREIARHMLVVTVPEAWTSQTCGMCGGKCAADEAVDANYRIYRKQKQPKATPREVRRWSVRGLRRCTNDNCRRYLNRDGNASRVIGRRGASLLRHGPSPVLQELRAVMDDEDREFDKLTSHVHS